MKIDCDRTVDDKDILALLDGTVEEVLFADAFHLQQSGKYLLGDIAAFLKDPPPLKSNNRSELKSGSRFLF